MSEPNAPQPALRTRPNADALPLDDLISHILSGKVRVPDFQRGLRWEESDARKLLDSLDRGYPIGMLQFWERAAPAGTVKVGTRSIAAPAISNAWFVLDGLQRCTALARTLAATEDEPWRTFYDLDSGEFVPRRKASGNRFVPVDVIFDQARLLHWAAANAASLKAGELDNLFALTKRLREFKVPVVTIVATEDEEPAVRDIFTRMNDTGKKLNVADLFRAMHEMSGKPQRSLDVALEDLETDGFGKFERDQLIQVFGALQGFDPTKLKAALSRPELLDDDSIPSVVLAVRAVIQFLRVDCRIPHLRLVPYSMVFYPLARFFHQHPQPQPRSRELLRRYVWRGFVHGEFRSDAPSIRAHLQTITPNENDTVQALLGLVSKTPATPRAAKLWSLNSAKARIETVVLLAQNPLSLRDGREIAPSSRPLDEDLLPPLPIVRESRADGVGARMISDEPPAAAVAALLENEVSDTDLRARLASHCISVEMLDLLRAGRDEEFVTLRSEHLQLVVSSFLSRCASWNPPDRDRRPLKEFRQRAAAALQRSVK